MSRNPFAPVSRAPVANSNPTPSPFAPVSRAPAPSLSPSPSPSAAPSPSPSPSPSSASSDPIRKEAEKYLEAGEHAYKWFNQYLGRDNRQAAAMFEKLAQMCTILNDPKFAPLKKEVDDLYAKFYESKAKIDRELNSPLKYKGKSGYPFNLGGLSGTYDDETPIPGVPGLSVLDRHEKQFVVQFLLHEQLIESEKKKFLESNSKSNLNNWASQLQTFVTWVNDFSSEGDLATFFKHIADLIIHFEKREEIMVARWKQQISNEESFKNSLEWKEKGDLFPTNDDKEIYLWSEKFKFIPKFWMLVCKDSRDYWTKVDKLLEERRAQLPDVELVLWLGRDSPVAQELMKKIVEVGDKYDSICFAMTSDLENLLKEYSEKIQAQTGSYGHVLLWGVQDLINYINFFKTQTKEDTLAGVNLGPIWDEEGVNVIRQVSKKNYKRANECFNTTKRRVDQNLTTSAEGKRRNLILLEEFKKEMMPYFKTGIPQIEKYELKGKIQKAKDAELYIEPFFASDPEFIAVKAKRDEIRKKREAAYVELKNIDDKIFALFKETANKLAASETDKLKDAAIDGSDFQAEEIINNPTVFIGKPIWISRSEVKGVPEKDALFDLDNGNWQITWKTDITGGEDFKEVTEVMNEIFLQVCKKHDVQSDTTKQKEGLDALAYQFRLRTEYIRGAGAWYVVGAIHSVVDYLSRHEKIADVESAIESIVPRNALHRYVEKQQYSSEYRHINVDGRTISQLVPLYRYLVSYSIPKKCILTEVSVLRCENFVSMIYGDKQKTSWSGIASRLKEFVSK